MDNSVDQITKRQRRKWNILSKLKPKFFIRSMKELGLPPFIWMLPSDQAREVIAKVRRSVWGKYSDEF